MNMNEENKTENPESGIQTYDRKKKSHGNFLKIGSLHSVKPLLMVRSQSR